MKEKKREGLGKLALLSCAIIWGSSFFIMKETISDMPFNFLLAARFLGGALLLFLFMFPKWKEIKKEYFKVGLVLGTLWYWAYWFQTKGLYHTTPGKNAFLTATYCVLVPFFVWMIRHIKPTLEQFLAGVLCFVGIGFISLDGSLGIGQGEILTIICGVFFSLHIVVLSWKSEGLHPVLLTASQFLFSGLWAGGMSLATETVHEITWTPGLLQSFLYLILMGTAVAVSLQSYGQKQVNASTASLILSFESVFGVLFSVIFYGEKTTLKLLVGFALVFAAVLVSESNVLQRFTRVRKKVDSVQE